MELFEMAIKYKGKLYNRVQAEGHGSRCTDCAFWREPLCKDYSDSKGASALCNLGVVGGYFKEVK